MRERQLNELEIRVLVVDLDGGKVRENLAATREVVAVALPSYAGAQQALVSRPVQAIVVACGAQPAAEVAELERLLAIAKDVPVMVVMSALDERLAVRLIKLGVRSLLLSQDARFLTTSLRELLRGGAPMSPGVSRLVLQRARRSSTRLPAVRLTDGDAPKLSTRQREILSFLQRGYSYDDIGTALDLSVNTVRSHVRIIYERLGAASKVEAVMIGLQRGLL